MDPNSSTCMQYDPYSFNKTTLILGYSHSQKVSTINSLNNFFLLSSDRKHYSLQSLSTESILLIHNKHWNMFSQNLQSLKKNKKTFVIHFCDFWRGISSLERVVIAEYIPKHQRHLEQDVLLLSSCNSHHHRYQHFLQ